MGIRKPGRTHALLGGFREGSLDSRPCRSAVTSTFPVSLPLSPGLPTFARPSTLRLNTRTKARLGSDDRTPDVCLRGDVTRNASFVAVDETELGVREALAAVGAGRKGLIQLRKAAHRRSHAE